MSLKTMPTDPRQPDQIPIPCPNCGSWRTYWHGTLKCAKCGSNFKIDRSAAYPNTCTKCWHIKHGGKPCEKCNESLR